MPRGGHRPGGVAANCTPANAAQTIKANSLKSTFGATTWGLGDCCLDANNNQAAVLIFFYDANGVKVGEKWINQSGTALVSPPLDCGVDS